MLIYLYNTLLGVIYTKTAISLMEISLQPNPD